jgi:hypothetical protein
MDLVRTCVCALLVTGIPAAAACGGGSSPEDEIRARAVAFVDAVNDGEDGEACAMTTDPDACQRTIALAEGFLGEDGFEALLPDDWRDQLSDAPVTFSDDRHATMAGLTGEDEPGQFVYEDGEWLIVFEDSGSFGSE